MISGLGNFPELSFELRDKDGNLKQKSRKIEKWYGYTHIVQEDAKGKLLSKLVYDWFGRLVEHIVWNEEHKKVLHYKVKYDKEGNATNIDKLHRKIDKKK
jgi:hypothetical protein